MSVTDAICLLLYWRQHPDSSAWSIQAERDARLAIERRAIEILGNTGRELLDAVIKSHEGH